MFASRFLVLSALLPAVAWAGATASSFKAEHRKGANYWNAASAIDGDPATAWMVPGESPNRGEWILVDLPSSTVDKLGMFNGWVANEKTFGDHPRIKTVKLEAFSLTDSQDLTPVGSTTASFEDTPEWQVVDVEDLKVGGELFGGKLKISVVDIYEGKDYPNLAISELLVYLNEFDALSVNLVGASEPIGGHIPELMRDDDPKTWYATEAEKPSFVVESSQLGLSSLGFLAGPNKHARPKTVELTANNRTLTHTLEDNAEVQWVQVPTITGYTGGAFGAVQVKVLDTYPGTEPGLAIAELKTRATNAEAF